MGAITNQRVARLRTRIYKRDGYRCRYCGVKVVDLRSALITREQSLTLATIDHIIPARRFSHRHVGPKPTVRRWSEENLVTACNPCNVRKGDRTPDEAGMIVLPL